MEVNKSVLCGVLGCVVLLMNGCATNSVFSAYPSQVVDIKQQVAVGEFTAARKVLEKKSQGADKLLYLMERGRIAQISGDIESSIADFEQVLAEFEAKEAAARITASGTAGAAGALLLNENAIPYEGESYERIFVHTFQALNFLQQRNLEAAGVEVRRANLEQQLALRENEAEVSKAEARDEEARKAAMIEGQNRDYKQKFSSLSQLASKVKNSFQNAYSFYISGLIYEMRGEYNDAYIDYKKALEIYPDNRYLRDDVVRLAKRLGMDADLAQLTTSPAKTQLKHPSEGEGKLVVLYEQGYVPEKKEVNILIDLRGVPNNMVFPTYVNNQPPRRPLVIGLNGARLGETETIVEPTAMAAKALEERLMGMIVRQGLRVLARERMKDKQMESVFGMLAGLGQMLLNRADLRSWLMLPAEVQILHTAAAQGEQTLTLKDGLHSSEVAVDIRPGRVTVVHVIAAGGRLHTRAITI